MSDDEQPDRRRIFRLRTSRMEAFSDGIFAIASTLLVLDLCGKGVDPARWYAPQVRRARTVRSASAVRQGASMTDDAAISYQAAVPGTPVLSSSGTEIGTLEHVLQVPEVDVFDGIVVATKAGLRFIDADAVQRITRSYIRCSLDDAQAGQLPPPDGPPVYRVDALADSGNSLHDILGRLFRRPRWIREHD